MAIETSPTGDNLSGAAPEEPIADIERMVAEMRSRLLPGGPPVDHPALYAYVAGVLDDGDRRLVAERIATWREWFEEYLPIRAAAEPETT